MIRSARALLLRSPALLGAAVALLVVSQLGFTPNAKNASVTSTLIVDGTVALADMADLATDKVIGRVSSGTGVPEAVTFADPIQALADDTSVAAMRTTLGFTLEPVQLTGYKLVPIAKAIASAATTQAVIANTHTAVRYVEAHGSAVVYDAAVFRVATGGVNANCLLGLYSHGSDGLPSALLWSQQTIDCTASSTTKTITFAGGTWEAAGANYKDGSNNFVPEHGETFWLSIVPQTANVTLSTIAVGSAIPLALNETTPSGAALVGVSRTTAGALPASFTSPAAVTSDIPLFALRVQ